jgi:hypothetical protein
MKKTLIISSMAIGCLALTVGLVLAPKAHAASSPSQTAQDIMVQTNLPNLAFQIDGTTTWTFDRDCAEGNYTASPGVWDGNTPTCDGNATNCAPANQPTPPPAPPVDAHGPNSIEHHAQQDRCTYFCGGTLSGWAYTNTAMVNGLNGHGNWTFTYNYSTSPNTALVSGGTCWSCQQTGGTVDVDFTGFVSSESFLNNRNTNTKKYSFTLLDSLGVSRVSGTTAQLQYSADGLFDDTQDLGTITFTPDPLTVTPSVNNYLYYGNAGVFGNSAVYSYLDAPTPSNNLGGRYINNILQLPPDNFAGNNNDLANGNVQEADYSGSFTGLTQAATYRISVSGTVKDNFGTGYQPFTVTSSNVIIGGCDTCTPPVCNQ